VKKGGEIIIATNSGTKGNVERRVVFAPLLVKLLMDLQVLSNHLDTLIFLVFMRAVGMLHVTKGTLGRCISNQRFHTYHIMIVSVQRNVRTNGLRKNAKNAKSKNAKRIHARANVKRLAISVRMEKLLPARNAKINGSRKNAKGVTRKV